MSNGRRERTCGDARGAIAEKAGVTPVMLKEAPKLQC